MNIITADEIKAKDYTGMSDEQIVATISIQMEAAYLDGDFSYCELLERQISRMELGELFYSVR